MDIGLRVVRGPDWTWGEQDGGEGHVGTVVRPDYDGRHRTVIDDTVFVRWDTGKIANYRIADAHDLRIYSSAVCGVQHTDITCDVCTLESFLGTRWKCSVCDNYDLCDECYHGDLHDLSHPFFRIDTTLAVGVLVPARKGSEKVETKGTYPGAAVVRSVHNWLMGEHDGGNEAALGNVLADESDNEDGGETESDTDKLEPIRRKCTPKSFGCVRVMWDTGDIVEQRRGYEGKVDVWCLNAKSGGHYYRDHLPVLDAKVLSSCSAFDESDTEETEADVDASRAEITRPFAHPTSLDDIMAQARGLGAAALGDRISLLRGNSNFRKGDRVQVCADPDVFKAKQTEEHGGWNDDMALCIGLTGTVTGVTPNDDVAVKYQNFRKNWIINPEVLTKRTFFVGDSVQIMSDEETVRNLQKGHGGWVCRMKDMLGKTGTVTQADRDGVMKVKLDNLEWMLNAKCCKLLGSTANKKKNDKDSDSDDEESTAGSDLLSGLLTADIRTPQGMVALAAQNQLGLLQAVVAQHPDKINIKVGGKTPLHLAAVQGHIDVVKFLLAKGADVTSQDDEGYAPLHYAAHKGHTEILELLLMAKGDTVNAVNYMLRSVLHVAVQGHSGRAVEILLRHSVNVNVQDDNGCTALHTAVHVLFHESIDLLVSRPDLNFSLRDANGDTALHLAARNGDALAVEKIVSKAPKKAIDAQKGDGYTALHIACNSGHYHVAEILVTQGKADLELVNAEGDTPLLGALTRAMASISELLVLHGANVNALNQSGDTCLHMMLHLVRRGDAPLHPLRDLFNAIQTTLIYSELPGDVPDGPWVALACFLVQHGANLFLPNRQGATPISLVTNESIRDILLSAIRLRRQ